MIKERPETTESDQITFFERSYERFLIAKRSAGGDSYFYRVGGTTVCLMFAGDALVPSMTPALEHLRVPALEPDLTVCVWDSRSTSVEMVPPPCPWENVTGEGDVLGLNSSRIRFAFHRADYSVTLLDHLRRTGIHWVPDAGAVPYWAQAHPLRPLFHWWMQHNGCHIVHAAAVGTDDGAVLLAGRGGMGKSTTALSCLEAGLYYLGDDAVVVRLEPEPVVYSLYGAAELHAEGVANFPSLSDSLRNPEAAGNEKQILYLYPRFQRQVVSEMPLRAILLPQRANLSETRVTPASTWKVQRAFISLSQLELPHLGRGTQDFMGRLCSTLPAYILDMAGDRKKTPPAIADLLKRPPAPQVYPHDDLGTGQTPLISVIVSVCNGDRYIKNTLAGALSQDYPALELIVIDDGSTDWTPEVISQLPYDVRYYRQEPAGLAAARNRGISEATGEVLAFLDVHDLWPADTLKRLVDELLRDPKNEVAHGYTQLVWYSHETNQFENIGNPKSHREFRAAAAVFRKSAFSKAGLFDSGPVFAQDTDWLARAGEANVQVARVDAVTLQVITHNLDVANGKTLGGSGAHRLIKETLDRRRAEAARARGGLPPA